MMLPRDLVRLALHNLTLHKIRSTLTSLGVIFGVGSVIAMLAISEGAKRKALEEIEGMGVDKIIVHTKTPAIEDREVDSSAAGLTDIYGLTDNDLEHIRRMENIGEITTMRNARKKIMRGTGRVDVMLVGVSDGFLEDSSSKLTQGRWFNKSDGKNKIRVCVIGSGVKRKLFGLSSESVLGKSVSAEGERFRIIGVLNNSLNTSYPELGSPNDMVFIPIELSRKLFGSYAYQIERRNFKITLIDYDAFIVNVNDLSYIDNTAKRITAYLSKTHSKVKDWGVSVPLDLLQQRESTQNIFTIVMGSIAGISLIVGGIGIMNIMLASVYERRKEIGTRRALGAQKEDILFQFLIETVFLTSLGGILGVLLGVLISQVITLYADMPTVYTWWSMAFSLLIAGLTGIVFGTYPAWKAAQQNPIEVLRSE